MSFSRGIGLDLDLDVSAVSFPFPPPRKIRKNNCFWHLFFCRGFFAETQNVSKNGGKKNTASLQVFMNMLLINLLIAIILDTYKEVQKAEESGEAVALAKNKTLDPKCPNKNRRGTVLISRKMGNFKGKLGKLGTKISS